MGNTVYTKNEAQPVIAVDASGNFAGAGIGNYLPLTGGTMSGDITLNGADLLTSSASFNDIGSSLKPFNAIYSDTFIGETKILNFIIGDGSTVITSGSQGSVRIPFNASALNWQVVGDISGSISVDVRAQDYATYAGDAGFTSADSIVGTEKPSITTAFKNQDTSLTSWSGISDGDYLNFHVDATPVSITRATISIAVSKDS